MRLHEIETTAEKVLQAELGVSKPAWLVPSGMRRMSLYLDYMKLTIKIKFMRSWRNRQTHQT